MLQHIKVVFITVLLAAAAQLSKASAPDSLQVSRSAKPRFVFNFDSRNTLFGNEMVRVSGLKTGLEWQQKWRTGLGFYFMRNPYITRFPAVSADKPATETHLKFHYGAVYTEYVLLQNTKWEISLPVQAGFGKLKNEYRTAAGTTLNKETRPLYLVEPSVAGHYKIWSWAGIGAGIGYRRTFLQDSSQNRYLNAPIYYVKIKLFTGPLYRQLRRKYCPES